MLIITEIPTFISISLIIFTIKSKVSKNRGKTKNIKIQKFTIHFYISSSQFKKYDNNTI